jgi:heptosyltransferase I
MKVLIIKTSSLGDVIHTLPALVDAKAAIPDISFDWVVEEAFVEIPSWHNAVKNVIPVAWRRWRKNITRALYTGELLNFIKTLRQNKYDLIIDAQGLMKSAVLAKIARGKCYGYDKNTIREPIAAWFYKKNIAIAKDQHAIARTRMLFARALKYRYSIPTVAITDYGININQKNFSQLQVINNLNNNKNYIVFLHGTSREKKCWNEQKWITLARFAADNDFVVYLPWHNNRELERAKRIAQHNDRVRILPKFNLVAMASLLQKAKAIVAVDTGLGHVAAALGVLTVSLYGTTDSNLCGTIGLNQVRLNKFEEIDAADVWRIIRERMKND